MMKPLLIKEIEDKWVRENFQRLQDFIRLEALFKGNWKFLEITMTAAVTNRDFEHGLGFQPKDVIQLSLTEGVTWDWKYSRFTPTTVRFTTSGAGTIRALVGRYEENV